jgi:hypothetical protein
MKWVSKQFSKYRKIFSSDEALQSQPGRHAALAVEDDSESDATGVIETSIAASTLIAADTFAVGQVFRGTALGRAKLATNDVRWRPVSGIAVSAVTPGQRGRFQTYGPVDPGIFTLGAGPACAVGWNSGGTLVRATDWSCVSAPNYAGATDENGVVTLGAYRTETFYAVDFGMDPTGVVDCTHALEAFVNHPIHLIPDPMHLHGPISGGIDLYFPSGRYRFNRQPVLFDTVVRLPQQLRLRGAGPGLNASTLLFYGAGDAIRLDSAGPDSNAGGRHEIRDLQIVGMFTKGANICRVIGATNTPGQPVRIHTSKPHGRAPGDQVVVKRVQGNTYANTDWSKPFSITVVDDDHYDLVGTDGVNGSPFASTTQKITGIVQFTGSVYLITLDAPHTCLPGDRGFVSGIGGAFDPPVNDEWQLCPVPGEPNRVYLVLTPGTLITTFTNVPGDGVTPIGTLTTSGLAFGVSGINQNGIHIVNDSLCTIERVDIHGFKYGITNDGGEVNRFSNINFGVHTLEADLAYRGYQDARVELGCDSGVCFRNGPRDGTNVVMGNDLQFNDCRYGVWTQGGVNLHLQDVNSELDGAVFLLDGGSNMHFDNVQAEGHLIGTIYVHSDTGSAGVYLVKLSNCFIAHSAPAVQMSLTNLQTISNLTLDRCDASGSTTGAAFAPISNARQVFSNVQILNCIAPVVGPYAGAFADAKFGPDPRYGFRIGHGDSLQAAIDTFISSHALPGAVWRGYYGKFRQIGVPTPDETGALEEYRSTRAVNAPVDAITQVPGAQDGDLRRRVSVADGASAANFDPGFTNFPTNDGFGTVTVIVQAAYAADVMMGARWAFRQDFAISNEKLSLLGDMEDIGFHDHDGNWTAPKLIVHSNKLMIRITCYRGHPSQWGLFFNYAFTGFYAGQ